MKIEEIAKLMVTKGRGILAADESTGTMGKRLKSVNIESTEKNRLHFRETLFTSSAMKSSISGVILYDETIKQKSSEGISIPELIKKNGSIPGIKVDKGVKLLAGSSDEKITEGLDGLRERMDEYYKLGARFAKWRAVYSISSDQPSEQCIKANAHALARYAAIVQEAKMVPIVEPEVIMDGSHDIEKCLKVTNKTLRTVFKQLDFQGVYIGGILLKPNMVISGIDCKVQASIKEVSEMTINCLEDSIPSDVPGVVFLSGGQNYKIATEHLNQMNKVDSNLCNLSFSYGRALQQPVISTWEGKEENFKKSQNEFTKRCKLNSLATIGQYETEMENI